VVESEFDPVTQELVTTYEFGWKSSVTDNWQVNGTVYYSDYKDKQVYGTIPVIAFGNLPALVNIPESQITGAELDTTRLLSFRSRDCGFRAA